MGCVNRSILFAMSQPITRKRRALTLGEMVVVMIILIAIASILIPLLDLSISTPNGDKSPEEIVTETTMTQIRDSLVGSSNQNGAWADVGQKEKFFIRDPSDLLLDLDSLKNKYTVDGYYLELTEFNPVTQIGWRGPYFVGQSRLIDAFGNELQVQVDFDGNNNLTSEEVRYARLVSLGPDGVLQTPLTTNDMIPGDDAGTELALSECGDDIVLFFFVADARE